MDEDKDVLEVVTPADETKEVEPKDSEVDDKNKNFAELRKQLEKERQEKADLQRLLEEKKEKDSTLNIEGDEPGEKPKKADDTLKIVFQRDMKEAVHQWQEKTKVSAEEWAQVKAKVSLKGDETISEIKAKISEAYISLPTVRERREKELIEKGKRMAMSEFSDDELDIGGGGDADFSGDVETHFTARERKFLDSMGVTPEERKKINKNATTNDWQIGQSPTRKFFQA
jgi:hypothetical protein